MKYVVVEAVVLGVSGGGKRFIYEDESASAAAAVEIC